ncbi:MAG: hypothetical protein FJ265_10900 [Planctomycetes bacterium]|nr:hypothetical protein [Planctomycetota bacterium]
MKLPIPLLLYTVSLGLAGGAGWTVYRMVPLLRQQTRQAATTQGMNEATARISVGRSREGVLADWNYGPRAQPWWAEFKAVNFIGKPPPPPPKGPEEGGATQAKEAPRDVRPLEQIMELVSLVYDSKDLGKGEFSHVIVRYKPEANVQPPEWYLRETAAAGPGAPVARPGDVAPPLRFPRGGAGRGAERDNQGGRGTRAATPTPMPTSLVGREILQKIWIQGDGDPRRDPRLWPPFSDIRLVRVDPSAQSAYFVRTPPPPAPGQPVEQPEEEQLLKVAMGLDQALQRELHRLGGVAPGAAGQPAGAEPSAPAGTWLEVDETTLAGNVRHIGRKLETRIRENPDELWEKVHVDTYVSKQSNRRGLQVRNIEPQVAAQFGVSQGDVLLEVNGRVVQTQAQALQFGKGEYKKGVRTFVTKWLSNGQVVERIYQAPDK